MKLLATIAALLLAFTPVASAQLDNNCAIVATEAYALLKPVAVWSKVIALHGRNLDMKVEFGHVMVCWQISKNGQTLIYDTDGTITLATHSREPKDIMAALNALMKGHIEIVDAHFIE